MPWWLVLLVFGLLVGAGAVLFVQERYLPPRLSAEASADLRRDYEAAESERQRLSQSLAEATRQLEAARTEQQRATQELGDSKDLVGQLREDLAAVVDLMPPDPRGAPIGIRAARLDVAQGALNYDLLLSREEASGESFTGVMQFVLTGTSGRNSRATAALPAVDIRVGRYESLRGSVTLPEGFDPKQATINLLDKIDGKTYGRRVINVR